MVNPEAKPLACILELAKDMSFTLQNPDKYLAQILILYTLVWEISENNWDAKPNHAYGHSFWAITWTEHPANLPA